MPGTSRSEKMVHKKGVLIAELVRVRSEILSACEMLDGNKHMKLFIGTWSARELLAHLAGWDVTNLESIDEIMQGCLPSFYSYADKDWASYNAKLVERFGCSEYKDQLELARKTHAKMISRLQDIPAEDLWLDRGIRSHGWIVTIGRLLEVEAKDEAVHLQQIRDFIEA